MQERSKSKERTIVSEAASHLSEILSRVPFLGLAEVQTNPVGFDLLLSVHKGKKRSRLVVEVRSHAQMRDARLAIEQLRHVCSQQPDSYPVFCSQYLSPPIREFCMETGLGFLDFAGNCRLVFADVFIERDAPAARPLEKKRLRSLFAPMAARRYDKYLKHGLPIATGAIEGTCRYLIKDRMDITGARWGLERAEAILKLRSIKSSDDFKDYWKFYKTQSHNRIHSSQYQELPWLQAA